MKVFLDDIRMPPDDSWVIVRDAQSCINLLGNNDVQEISLDHDLGEDVVSDFLVKNNGYFVALYIEDRVAIDCNYNPPKIGVHSANPVGVKNINMAICSIEKLMAARNR